MTAMARAATGDNAKWVVFAAATSALALSTLIAVLVGAALTRVVPEKYIKLAAGLAFVLIGLILLRSALVPAKVAAAIEARPATGLSGFVLRLAATFEASAAAG